MDFAWKHTQVVKHPLNYKDCYSLKNISDRSVEESDISLGILLNLTVRPRWPFSPAVCYYNMTVMKAK